MMSKGNGKLAFKELPMEKKAAVIIVIVQLVIFLVLCTLASINRIDIALGWLLGSIVAIGSYFTLIISLGKVVDVSNTKFATKALSALSFSLRFVLYAAGLSISGICTFKPEWFGGFNLFNFWSTFAAYMPIYAILIIVGLAQKTNSVDTNIVNNTKNKEEEK